MRVKVLLNPHAGQFLKRDRLSDVECALNAAGIQFDLAILRRWGQAKQEAIVASFGSYDAIIAAGGDGTVHEIINGLISCSGSGPTRPIGILPMGTGNDFSDMAGLPRDLEAAAHVIAAGHVHSVDAGRVSYTTHNDKAHNHTAWQGRFFDNNCAAAMEPVVTLESKKSTYLSGNIRYVVALARSLTKIRAWDMKIAWDAGVYEGPIYLLSVANSPRTGGLFMVAPNAIIDDGFFDFVYAPLLPLSETIRLLPRLLKGTHIRHPKVYSGRTTQLYVESRPGTPLHADGELITESAVHINYRILPGKISLLVP